MTQRTQQAIETLGRKLQQYDWGLYNDTIRCFAIADTEHHGELTLCPVAMAVTHAGSERILELVERPDCGGFHEEVETARPRLREHMAEEDPQADEAMLDGEALLYAAAAVIHETPDRAETGWLLNLDSDTIEAIAWGADTPNSEVGRALATALASASNELRKEHESRFGQLTIGANRS